MLVGLFVWMLVTSRQNFQIFTLFSMHITLKPSDPEYNDYNEKLTLLVALKNHHMYSEFRDMPEVERMAEIQKLETLLEEMSH